MSAEPAGEPIGSVTEEAAKLADALREWAGRDERSSWLSIFDDQHLATGAPECVGCPVCRTVSAIRESAPQIRAGLEEALTSVSGLVRTVLMAYDEPGRPRPGDRAE